MGANCIDKIVIIFFTMSSKWPSAKIQWYCNKNFLVLISELWLSKKLTTPKTKKQKKVILEEEILFAKIERTLRFDFKN